MSQLSKDANLEKKISKPLRLKPDEKANELMKNAAMIAIHFLNRQYVVKTEMNDDDRIQPNLR